MKHSISKMTIVLAALSLCAAGFSQTLRWEIGPPGVRSNDVAYHSNGQEIVRLMPNQVEVLNANTGDLLRTLSFPAGFNPHHLSMDGTHVLLLSSNQLSVMETQQGTIVGSTARPSGASFQISPDGSMVSNRDGSFIRIRQLSNLGEVFRSVEWPVAEMMDPSHIWFGNNGFGGGIQFSPPTAISLGNLSLRRYNVQTDSFTFHLLGTQGTVLINHCGFVATSEGNWQGAIARMGGVTVHPQHKLGQVRTRNGVAYAAITDGKSLYRSNATFLHFPGQITNFSISADYSRVYVEGTHFHGVYSYAGTNPNPTVVWQRFLPASFNQVTVSRMGETVAASNGSNIVLLRGSDGAWLGGTSYATGPISPNNIGGLALSPAGRHLTVASQRIFIHSTRYNANAFRFESFAVGNPAPFFDGGASDTPSFFARNPVYINESQFMATSSHEALLTELFIVRRSNSTISGISFHDHAPHGERVLIPGSASISGQHAIVVGPGSQLFLVRTNPGSLLMTLSGTFSSFFPNENKVVFADAVGLKTVTFPTGTPNHVLNLANIRALKVIGNGSRIAVATSTQILIYSYPSMSLLTSFSPPGGINAAAFTDDGAFVYVTNLNGRLSCFSVDMETPLNNGLYFRSGAAAPIPGLVVAWRLSGGAVSLPGVVIDAASSEWEPAAIGPVTLAGPSGIYWQNVDSSSALFNLVARWAVDHNGVPTGVMPVYSSGSPDWRLRAVSDVDANGNADWHWQNTSTGLVVSWLMNAAAEVQSVRVVGFASAGLELVSVANIDGVPGAEYIFWNPANQEVVAWRTDLTGGILQTVSMGSIPAGTRATGLISFDGATQRLAVQRISDGVVLSLPISADLTLGTAVPLAVTGDNWRLVGTGRP